jgi:hypothetical protein
MNLRLSGGKIPIQTGSDRHPIMLVEPPDRGLFDSLFHRSVTEKQKDAYWMVMQSRLAGMTLKDVAILLGITRERVRQMEAKIVRQLSSHWRSVIASEIAIPETTRPLHDNR